MSFIPLIKAARADIIDRWTALTAAGYADETARFLLREGNRFANPVGDAIRRGTAEIFDALLAGGGHRDWDEILDGVLRIRAVQDFSAAQAVSFVFLLKRAILDEIESRRKKAEDAARKGGPQDSTLSFDEKCYAEFSVSAGKASSFACQRCCELRFS